MKKSEIKLDIVRPFFRGDLLGMLQSCKPLKNFFTVRSILLSLVLPTIVVVILYLKQIEINALVRFIETLSNLGSSIIGVLLGISLGGFILVVSYGNQSLIDKTISKQASTYKVANKMQYSYIQVSVGKYGLIVLLQFIIFAIFLASLLATILEFNAPKEIAFWTNLTVIWALSCLLFYVMFLTYQLILNIFTLSQTASLNQFIEQFDD